MHLSLVTMLKTVYTNRFLVSSLNTDVKTVRQILAEAPIGIRSINPMGSFSAHTSPARAIRHSLGLKMPKGYGWLMNPRRSIYNKIYRRLTIDTKKALMDALNSKKTRVK